MNLYPFFFEMAVASTITIDPTIAGREEYDNK
jgi:hypothetical protein